MVVIFLIAFLAAVAFHAISMWKFTIEDLLSKANATQRQSHVFSVTFTGYLPLAGLMFMVPAASTGSALILVLSVVVVFMSAALAADFTARVVLALSKDLRSLARHQLVENNWPFFCRLFIEQALKRAETSGTNVPQDIRVYLTRMMTRSSALRLF